MSSVPATPPLLLHNVPPVAIAPDDLAVLDFLSHINSNPPKHSRRDAPLDPLLMAAAVASGPHLTRHHFHHAFFPPDPDAAPLWHFACSPPADPAQPRYLSQQAPRSHRLHIPTTPHLPPSVHSPRPILPRLNIASPGVPQQSLSPSPDVTPALSPTSTVCSTDALPESASALDSPPPSPRDPVTVTCMVRTRIPTPHGPAFLHLYHNNRDAKEHLAVVLDPAQLRTTDDGPALALPPIRSRSLDAVWHPNESDMERITRGAYLGRLSESTQRASAPAPAAPSAPHPAIPAPLVRIHSECFTGETIGSLRCDCGEQLDEALRLIAQPIALAPPHTATVPGRGAIVYMRQEGRGIGLLDKLRAYNLQDLGHDTVAANLLLGRGADERGYDVAAAILRDLGLGGAAAHGEDVRLLTNNPDKVAQLAKEGVAVAERVPMVPRSWRCQQEAAVTQEREAKLRAAGATLIGAGAAHGAELDKYLRTKVLRMGHMLSLPASAGAA